MKRGLETAPYFISIQSFNGREGYYMVLLRARRGEVGFLSMVVVAAGSSRRMGFDKIFSILGGRPVMSYSLHTFQTCDIVKEIIVVVNEESFDAAGEICGQFTKVKKLVVGGARRIDSVINGALETDRCAKFIGVHDGARPLVTYKIIEDTAALAAKHGAAVPAISVNDTIKTADCDKMVTGTPARSEMFAIQTPQIFDGSILKGALKKAAEAGGEITDDSMAVEAIGMHVFLSEGSEENLKLTRPIDLITAEGILKKL